MPRILRNPRILFWIAFVVILLNCSALTVTRAVFHGELTQISILLDFFPILGFLVAFFLFKSLACSAVN